MATTYTANTSLRKPAAADRNWDTPVNANADLLDGLTAVGSLCVALTETPSASLNVKVAAGSYRKSDGTIAAYAGTSSQALTLSATNYLYLTDAGVLTVNTTGFPAAGTAHVRLATVVAGASTITSIADARIPWQSIGSPLTSGADQVAVGALATQTLTDSSGGTASTTLAAIVDAPTADAVASLAAQLAHVLADLNALKTLVNAERTALMAAGTMKGSA